MKIGFIGCGNMGGAILQGILQGGHTGCRYLCCGPQFGETAAKAGSYRRAGLPEQYGSGGAL